MHYAKTWQLVVFLDEGALADLAHRLIEATAADVEAVTHEAAHVGWTS